MSSMELAHTISHINRAYHNRPHMRAIAMQNLRNIYVRGPMNRHRAMLLEQFNLVEYQIG